ncbi:MAG: hypothetical protein M1818_004945 [Claussenomyces sp. TS43310]|nr:MAG: hypothetical protein M1818_004945 [Claussenomyces sp. TS43310]
MASPKPFVIDVPQAKIDRLKQMLALTEFPDELEDAGWDLGCPLSEMRRLVKAWQSWDWRRIEAKLNQLPHFTADVEVDGYGTLNIHHIHQKSEVKGAIPLLFLHGWPGSFVEVEKLLPLLAQHGGDKPAFHVVAPSLPNFGFSQGVKKRGFAMAQYAETCHKLMLQLGYPEYVTQGGDWGSQVSRVLGMLYPDSCKANHLNMVLARAPTLSQSPLLALQHSLRPYSEAEHKGMRRSQSFGKEGIGYNILQCTKPQTVGYALHDSPVALLAWIYEKLHDWTDSYPWSDDEILTWISIYAFSRAGPAAAERIYYEMNHATSYTYEHIMNYLPKVKLGLTYNAQELTLPPRIWGKTLGPVVFEAENDRGGHFYATEYPDRLVRDLQTMFGKTGGAYAVVSEKDGYGV